MKKNGNFVYKLTKLSNEILLNKNDQPKRQLLFEMQSKRVGNYILFQQEITSRGCKPSILEM